MKFRYVVAICLALLLMPFSAHAQNDVFWSQENWTVTIGPQANDGPQCMLSHIIEMPFHGDQVITSVGFIPTGYVLVLHNSAWTVKSDEIYTDVLMAFFDENNKIGQNYGRGEWVGIGTDALGIIVNEIFFKDLISYNHLAFFRGYGEGLTPLAMVDLTYSDLALAKLVECQRIYYPQNPKDHLIFPKNPFK